MMKQSTNSILNPDLGKWEPLLVFSTLLVLSFAFYGDFLYMNPRFNHLWAQTDRMCLALGFVDNGLNFFKPQVCNLGTSDGTVGVEFPILFYLAAICMKIFNTDSPFFVRFISLTMSLIGLTALFRIFRIIRVNLFLSFFGIYLIYFSPIFFFYQANFNPNHFGFGLACLSMLYLVRYIYERKFSYVLLFNFFGVIAMLTKASFGLYLIAGHVFIYYLNGLDYKHIVRQTLPLVIGLMLYVSHFMYNLYLNKTHGSYFFTINLESYENFFQFLWDTGHVISFWFKDIIFVWHWALVVLSFLFVGAFSGLFVSKNKFILSALIFFGSVSVYFMMGKQYMIHDYYIIDVFYLPLALFLVCLFYKIQQTISNQAAVTGLSLVFIAISTVTGMEMFKGRTTLKMDNRGDWITRDFEGSYQVLDKLGISRKEKLVIFDAFCPDGILYFLKRKGTNLNFLNPVEIQSLHKNGFNYVVIQAMSIKEYPDRMAEGLAVLEPVFTNEKFTVYKIKS